MAVKNWQKNKQRHCYLQHCIYYNWKCNIHSVNPLYLLIDHANGYIEEKGVNKYLVFDSTDKNKELLKKTMTFLMELGAKLKK